MMRKLNLGIGVDESMNSELKPSKRLSAGFIVKFAISFAILGVLFWKFRGDLPSLRQLDAVSVAAAISLLLLQPPLIGLRWWLVLRMYGSKASPGSAVAITWVSVFANQFLPASIGGDVVRMYYARRHSESLGPAIASVMIDRLMALLALAALIVAFAPILAGLIDQRITVVVAMLCVLGVLAAVALFWLAGRANQISARWAMLERLARLAHYLLRIVAHPTYAVVTLAIAVIVHLLSFTALLLIARGLGVLADAGPFMAIAAILTFVQVVPISIGGWGVREAAAIALLGLIGVEAGTALLASILLGLSYGMASLPGAAIWPYFTASREPVDHAIGDK